MHGTYLLLAHSAWVRALALRLVRDASRADDLVQDTWIAARNAPADEVRSPRRFLAGVLSNLVRQERRGETRRKEREDLARGRDEALSVTETLERAELGRELVALVMALDEPFRSAVLLRYYEGLPPREVARRLDVPVKTVNSRLARGLERLREGWKRTQGEDGAWFSSLLLLARSPSGGLPLPGVPDTAATTGPPAGSLATASATESALPWGWIIMNTKLALACFAIAGSCGLVWLWKSLETLTPQAGSNHAEASIAGGLGEVYGVPVVALPETVAEPAPASRESLVEVVKSGAALPDAPVSELRVLRGRVLDAEASPLAGIEVAFTPMTGWQD